MAGIDITVDEGLLSGLLSGDGTGVAKLLEMVVQGVSTRKVAAITEELCGTEVSKSCVSRLCEALDARLAAFKERRLEDKFPFVLIDAMYIKARGDERVQSKAVLIASGIDEAGYRQVLGLAVGDSESASTWGDFLKALKARGLSGVD